MISFEPVDINYNKIGDEDYKWDDDVIKDLEVRFNKLRGFDETLNESTDENTIEMTMKTKDALKHDTIELAANQIYDRLTIFFNNDRERFGIQGGKPIIEPIRENQNFKLTKNGKLSYAYKKTVVDFGNINNRLKAPWEINNNRLKAPWEIHKLGVAKLRLMGFTNIMYEDINPYDRRFKRAREEVMKLNDNLDERSKAIESSSTTDAEAIEMIEVTSKDIDTTVNRIHPSLNLVRETSYYHLEN